jgi:hypothetical protein
MTPTSIKSSVSIAEFLSRVPRHVIVSPFLKAAIRLLMFTAFLSRGCGNLVLPTEECALKALTGLLVNTYLAASACGRFAVGHGELTEPL